MKNKIFSCLLILTSAQLLVAQPVLTSTCNPYAGYTTIWSSASSDAEITTGPLQTWDLSDLDIGPILYSTTFAEAYPHPGSTYFPSADLRHNVYGADLFVMHSGSRALSLGYYINETTYTRFIDPYEIHRCPTAYGDSWIDTVHQEIHLPAVPLSFVMDIDTITANGYGVLILPDRTIDDVLLIERRTAQIDTTADGVRVRRKVQRSLYTNNLFEQIVNRTTVYISINGIATDTTRTTETTESPSTSIASAPSDPFVSLFPNPTTGVFTVVFDGFDGPASYTILDAQGRVMAVGGKVVAGTQRTISLGDAASGLYLLKLVSGNGVWTERLIVE